MGIDILRRNPTYHKRQVFSKVTKYTRPFMNEGLIRLFILPLFINSRISFGFIRKDFCHP